MSKEVQTIVKSLSDKHAEKITVMNLGESTTLADTFILATANSDVHMNTLMETTLDTLEELGLPSRLEGASSPRWRLIDAGNLVIHIFSRQGRDFYGIERIWGDAETVEIGEDMPL
ncbi:MAG: ribosome silencing factor [Synergistaceae bacterium]|nr:ribosome silencing factor [Synergistaceae bacterium]